MTFEFWKNTVSEDQQRQDVLDMIAEIEAMDEAEK